MHIRAAAKEETDNVAIVKSKGPVAVVATVTATNKRPLRPNFRRLCQAATERHKKTPPALDRAHLSGDGFSIQLSRETQTCEGLCVARRVGAAALPLEGLQSATFIRDPLSWLEDGRGVSLFRECAFACVFRVCEVPPSSVSDGALKVRSTPPGPTPRGTFLASLCFSLTPLTKVALPCCICPTVKTLKESNCFCKAGCKAGLLLPL